jgi:hypothetical protein
MDLIWAKQEGIYFCKWGWTGDLPARQTAQMNNAICGASWFETAQARLLTMRVLPSVQAYGPHPEGAASSPRLEGCGHAKAKGALLHIRMPEKQREVRFRSVLTKAQMSACGDELKFSAQSVHYRF